MSYEVHMRVTKSEHRKNEWGTTYKSHQLYMWVTDSACMCKYESRTVYIMCEYEQHSQTRPPQKAHPADESRTILVSNEQWALHIWVKNYVYESRSIYTHVQVWVRNYMYESRTVVMSHGLYIWVTFLINLYIYIYGSWLIYIILPHSLFVTHICVYTHISQELHIWATIYIYTLYIYTHI